MALARSPEKPCSLSSVRLRIRSGSHSRITSGRNQSVRSVLFSLSTVIQLRIRRKGCPASTRSASASSRLRRRSISVPSRSRQAASRAFGAMCVSKISSSSPSSGRGGRSSISRLSPGAVSPISRIASRIRAAAAAPSSGGSIASEAGVTRISSSRSWLRWLMQSKVRRESTSSSKNSMRIPSRPAGGYRSRIAPRRANWPLPSTMFTRSYPIRVSRAARVPSPTRSPGFRVKQAARKISGSPMRCIIASALVTSSRAPRVTADSASRRRQLLSRLPAARVRSISPPGRQGQSSPVIWRTSSARRPAFRSCSAISSTRFPRSASRAAAAAASAGVAPPIASGAPAFVCSIFSHPGIRIRFNSFNV